MALLGSNRQPTMVPTLPTGSEIASYGTYLEAQKAVDYLSDESFSVQHVTIVGTDLRMVERITGRLNYPRVALAGAMTGAWFGLLISLLMYLFTPDGGFPVLAGVLIGAAFGILFGVVSYAMTGGKRDFTSASQVVASRYAILCDPQSAAEAGRLLTQGGHAGRVSQVASQSAVPAPAGEPAPVSAGQQAAPPTDAGERPSSPGASDEKRERPRYGLRYEDLEPGTAPVAQPGASPAAEQPGAEPGGHPAAENGPAPASEPSATPQDQANSQR